MRFTITRATRGFLGSANHSARAVLRPVEFMFAGWPGALAWVEDGFQPEARAWAAERLALGWRTWLVDVTETGLTDETTEYLLEWASVA